LILQIIDFVDHIACDDRERSKPWEFDSGLSFGIRESGGAQPEGLVMRM
jgi:hypothetical protein